VSGHCVAPGEGDPGLSIIDISTPAAARISSQVALVGAQAVTADAGTVYVGLNSGAIVAVDLVTGAVLNQLSVTNAVWDVGLAGNYLYAVTDDQLVAIS